MRAMMRLLVPAVFLLACNFAGLPVSNGETPAEPPAAEPQDGPAPAATATDDESPAQVFASTDKGPLVTDPSPPDHAVKLIFIHHSSGENWLADENGGLALALMQNHYFVSDTNYDWGPADPQLEGPIGSFTDTGHWWNWFVGPGSEAALEALYAESEPHASYSRLDTDPGGENEIILFKSCFPNSAMDGSPSDPPASGDNPLRGTDSYSGNLTVANAKGIYLDLYDYFSRHTDKLFVVVTAPPLLASETSPEQAANARAFNRWLVTEWLRDYPYTNLAVFDFYNVLTSNDGNPGENDLGADGGNHHRFRNGQVEYITDRGADTSAYAENGDSHPTAAGNQKATGEFLDLLNIFYHRWRG